jgi:hypothetical protein
VFGELLFPFHRDSYGDKLDFIELLECLAAAVICLYIMSFIVTAIDVFAVAGSMRSICSEDKDLACQRVYRLNSCVS